MPPTRIFPPSLGGPPALERFIVVVVDEPTTKLAALTAGELDLAGIQPAHARFVERDPELAVVTYPLLLTYGIVFNTRRAPFDRLGTRRAVDRALDRREIVDGYLYGFGTPATGPVPPDVPGYLPVAADTASRRSAPRDARTRARFELLTVGSGEAALEQMVQAQLAPRGVRSGRSGSSSCRPFWRGSMVRRTTSMRRCSASPAIRGSAIWARWPRWRG